MNLEFWNFLTSVLSLGLVALFTDKGANSGTQRCLARST